MFLFFSPNFITAQKDSLEVSQPIISVTGEAFIYGEFSTTVASQSNSNTENIRKNISKKEKTDKQNTKALALEKKTKADTEKIKPKKSVQQHIKSIPSHEHWGSSNTYDKISITTHYTLSVAILHKKQSQDKTFISNKQKIISQKIFYHFALNLHQQQRGPPTC